MRRRVEVEREAEPATAERDRDVAELFARSRDGAARFAYVLTGSSAVADDIVHDAFVQVLRRWNELTNPRA